MPVCIIISTEIYAINNNLIFDTMKLYLTVTFVSLADWA